MLTLRCQNKRSKIVIVKAVICAAYCTGVSESE